MAFCIASERVRRPVMARADRVTGEAVGQGSHRRLARFACPDARERAGPGPVGDRDDRPGTADGELEPVVAVRPLMLVLLAPDAAPTMLEPARDSEQRL